jgi:hypothetical protein
MEFGFRVPLPLHNVGCEMHVSRTLPSESRSNSSRCLLVVSTYYHRGCRSLDRIPCKSVELANDDCRFIVRHNWGRSRFTGAEQIEAVAQSGAEQQPDREAEHVCHFISPSPPPPSFD